MSLQQIYTDSKNTLESQKYKVASGVVDINARIGGLLSEISNLRDTLIRIRAENASICDETELAEIDSVIERADVEAVAAKLAHDPLA